MQTLILKAEVYKAVGCAIEVLNGIGHGLHETAAMMHWWSEFGLIRHPVWQQPRYPIVHKDVEVGEHDA